MKVGLMYYGIKTRYASDFPLCFPHELIMRKLCITGLLIRLQNKTPGNNEFGVPRWPPQKFVSFRGMKRDKKATHLDYLNFC